MMPSDNPWGRSTVADNPTRIGGSSQKLTTTRDSDKFGRAKKVAVVGFEKTKVVAVVGFEKTKVAAKKVKQSASLGINWIKLKLISLKKK